MLTALNPYFGEFLVSPVPLELALNYCSHKCPFCFANLNTPGRKANMPELMRFLGDYQNRNTLTAQLLQHGYPVCLSNHVDPFAASNYAQSLPLIEMFVAMGIPVQFQTRGAFKDNLKLVEQALDLLPGPTVWYVSIELWDDNTRKKLEPGAPSIPHRWDLIELVKSRGHHVELGLNPCVEDWLPGDQLEQIITKAKSLGVGGVWTERLHFTYQQRDAMSEREKAVLTPELITRCMKRHTQPKDRAFLERCRAFVIESGLEVFSVGQPNRSDFFKPYDDTYKTFPTLQGFINHCYDNNLTEQLIPFGTFADYFAARFPPGRMPIDAYVGSTARNLWHTHKVPAQMTYKQLLAIMYQDTRCKQCPARLPSFAFAAQWDDTTPAGWIQYVDEQGLPYLIFDPDGFEDYFVHVDLDAADAPVAPDILDTAPLMPLDQVLNIYQE